MNATKLRTGIIIAAACAVTLPALTNAAALANVGVSGITATSDSGAAADITVESHVQTRPSTDIQVTGSAVVSDDSSVDMHDSSLMTEDSDVTAVNSSDSSVAVSYKEPAKLFGIFSVSVPATAEAKADGTVTVKYPWYAFLMSKDDASLQAAVTSHVSNPRTSGSFSASARMQLADSLRAGLKSFADSNSSVQSNSDATVK